jgi:hypothetical protein
MKSFADEIEAKSQTEDVTIKLNVPRDHLFKTDEPSKFVTVGFRTERKNDLQEWRGVSRILCEGRFINHSLS